MTDDEREALARIVKSGLCPACGGGRLKPEVLACKIEGKNIAHCADMEIDDLIGFLGNLTAPETATVVATLIDRLEAMIGLGLDYLSLSRETPSLSGGESQRVKMVRHLGSSLSDIAYIFDEPSTGLHPRDVHQVTELLARLRDKGNSVLVVEHDPDVIAVADHVIDVGPDAGEGGGTVVFQGSLAQLRRAATKTAKAFSARRSLKERPRSARGALKVRGAKHHNLQDVEVDFPLGTLTVVAGVAGSGKSTLTRSVLARRYPEIACIDQSALGGSRRSTPASYLGILDHVRNLFAKASGKPAGLFSSNSTGACPVCRGLGVIRTDLAFMDAAETTCEACNGTGYSDAARAESWHGYSIDRIAGLSVDDAASLFVSEANIVGPLEQMKRVGLGYMPLGQQLHSLSGGERQRLRLADELGKESSIYLLDEPTSGLHMSDVDRLLALFDALVEQGKSLIVVEHNVEVIANADWIIELGPGAGKRGGKVIFEGTPQMIVSDKRSVTGPFVRKYLSEPLLQPAAAAAPPAAF